MLALDLDGLAREDVTLQSHQEDSYVTGDR
jgi:hypothetical protein